MPTWEQKQLIFQKIGYEPTETEEPIHRSDARVKQITGGERGGKSNTSARDFACRYWAGTLYWLVGADYEMCRPEFGYMVDDFHKLGLVVNCHFPSRDQCVLDLAGGIHIETKSAKYPERLAATAPDGILICEAAQVGYEIFLRCLGRLAEKRGWLVMSGTFETSLDWFADKATEYEIAENPEGGVTFALPSWSNKYVYPGGYDDPEIQRLLAIYGKDKFLERFGGKRVKPKGLVFPEYKTTLHTGNYPIDSSYPIDLGIDPGYFPGVYAVEIIQFVNDHIYIVDEIYEQHLITDQIIDILQKKPYWKDVEGGAIDVAAKQHQGQKPVISIWRDKGKLNLNNQRVPIEDGIDRLRTFLIPHPVTKEVQVHIDSRCRGIISEFGGCKPPPNIEQGGMYKQKLDKDGTVLSEKPDDKHNHGIKALIYAIAAKYGLAPRGRGPAVSYPQYY